MESTEKKKAYMREYFNKRYHNDPEFREETVFRTAEWQRKHPEERRQQRLRWSKRRSIKNKLEEEVSNEGN